MSGQSHTLPSEGRVRDARCWESNWLKWDRNSADLNDAQTGLGTSPFSTIRAQLNWRNRTQGVFHEYQYRRRT